MIMINKLWLLFITYIYLFINHNIYHIKLLLIKCIIIVIHVLIFTKVLLLLII